MPFDNASQAYIFAAYNYTTTYENHTSFPNGTLSNFTKCYMIRDSYMPLIFPNGTVINGTTCDSPLLPLKSHSITGISFAALFILLLPFCVASLKIHGPRAYTAKSKLYPYGKRWEFYFQIITICCIVCAAFFSIEIDRAVVQGSAIAVFGLFWSASLPTTLAAIWELSRNWGQVESDRYRELNPELSLAQHEKRRATKIQFWMPCLFYVLDFMCLFLLSFRPWTGVIRGYARSATDGRFKAGAMVGVLAYLVIVWCILNAITAYRPRLRTLHFGVVMFSMSVILVRIFYTNYMMYHYQNSAFNPTVNAGYVIILGYLPILLVYISHNVRGLMMENVDKTMLKRRLEKEREWQATLKKTYGAGKGSSSFGPTGLKRSDIADDWMKKPIEAEGSELKNMNYVVEKKAFA